MTETALFEAMKDVAREDGVKGNPAKGQGL